MSEKPRNAFVWYKMPSYFFAFIAEEKKKFMLNFVIKTLYRRLDNATARQSKIPTRQQLPAP